MQCMYTAMFRGERRKNQDGDMSGWCI